MYYEEIDYNGRKLKIKKFDYNTPEGWAEYVSTTHGSIDDETFEEKFPHRVTEDPFILGDPPDGRNFSAWDYAEKLCNLSLGHHPTEKRPPRQRRNHSNRNLP